MQLAPAFGAALACSLPGCGRWRPAASSSHPTRPRAPRRTGSPSPASVSYERPESQLARRRAGQVDGASEPLVGHVGLLAVDVPLAGVRVERPARDVPVHRRLAGELRELVRRQEARRGEQQGRVVLVPRRAGGVEVAGEAGERVLVADQLVRLAVWVGSAVADVDVGAQPVLLEVVQERQARVRPAASCTPAAGTGCTQYAPLAAWANSAYLPAMIALPPSLR